jgi:hypothetical protein
LLNQHDIVVEDVQWFRPDVSWLRQNFGGTDLARLATYGDTDGVIQTRCRRGCGLVFPYSWTVRPEYDRREAGRAMIDRYRKLAQQAIRGHWTQ